MQTAQMAYWQKTVKLALYYNSTCRVLWILRYSMLLATVFNEDDGSWDKGMVKVYDFANDFISNINNIMVLPKS
jgi:hypothetical protein